MRGSLFTNVPRRLPASLPQPIISHLWVAAPLQASQGSPPHSHTWEREALVQNFLRGWNFPSKLSWTLHHLPTFTWSIRMQSVSQKMPLIPASQAQEWIRRSEPRTAESYVGLGLSQSMERNQYFHVMEHVYRSKSSKTKMDISLIAKCLALGE